MVELSIARGRVYDPIYKTSYISFQTTKHKKVSCNTLVTSFVALKLVQKALNLGDSKRVKALYAATA